MQHPLRLAVDLQDSTLDSSLLKKYLNYRTATKEETGEIIIVKLTAQLVHFESEAIIAFKMKIKMNDRDTKS